MKYFSISIRIWAGTVLLNALFFGLWFLFAADLEGMLIFILLSVGGCMISFPLLWPVTLLVKASTRLPYSVPARMAWLGFILIAQNFALLELAAWSIEGSSLINCDPYLYLFWVSSLALICVMRWMKPALVKLNSGHQ